MKRLANQHISRITPYQPGKPIDEVKRELRLKQAIKLASNENPIGPSPKAVSAMRQAAGSVNRYPDGGCFYLKNKLAKKLKITEKKLIFGNGSDEILDLIIKAFAKRGDSILTSKCTFLEYKITAQIQNIKVGEVAIRGFKYDLKAIAQAVTKKTKIIFVANPNNPTGTYVSKKEVETFLRAVGKDVIVVFDEAYKEYVSVSDYPDTAKYINKKNVIVLRTFSKAYGLAGLRIGYCLASPELIDAMNRVRQPFNINSVAQAAALAGLADAGHVQRVKSITKQGRQYLYEVFKKLGLKFVPSVCNFILFDTAQDGKKVFEKLLRQGVIVRPMGIYGLKTFLRVTIGTMQENRKFAKALKGCL